MSMKVSNQKLQSNPHPGNTTSIVCRDYMRVQNSQSPKNPTLFRGHASARCAQSPAGNNPSELLSFLVQGIILPFVCRRFDWEINPALSNCRRVVFDVFLCEVFSFDVRNYGSRIVIL